jgi:hypothetical protein
MQRASIASPPRVRDDAYAPLVEAGRHEVSIVFRKTEGKFSRSRTENPDQIEMLH